MWFEHLKAWWRGDLVAITSIFNKMVDDIRAHEKYLTTVADNQAQAARSLAARSKWLYDEADKARKVASNIANSLGL